MCCTMLLNCTPQQDASFLKIKHLAGAEDAVGCVANGGPQKEPEVFCCQPAPVICKTPSPTHVLVLHETESGSMRKSALKAR